MGLHDVGWVGSCKAPHHIASSVSHMSANTVGALVHIIDQCLVEDRDKLLNSLRQEESSPAQLCETEACPVPG